MHFQGPGTPTLVPCLLLSGIVRPAEVFAMRSHQVGKALCHFPSASSTQTNAQPLNVIRGQRCSFP